MFQCKFRLSLDTEETAKLIVRVRDTTLAVAVAAVAVAGGARSSCIFCGTRSVNSVDMDSDDSFDLEVGYSLLLVLLVCKYFESRRRRRGKRILLI